jgi:hypothetical protein
MIIGLRPVIFFFVMLRIVHEMYTKCLALLCLHDFVAICHFSVSFCFYFVKLFLGDTVTNRLRHYLIGRGVNNLHWSRMDNDQTKSRLDQWIARARQNLATRRGEKPLTKAGQLRAVWPEIQIALDDGQSLKAVRGWLEEQGVVFTIDPLRTYVSRIRRERRKKAAERFLDAAMATPGPGAVVTAEPPSVAPTPVPPASEPIVAERTLGPLAQAQEALAKRRFDIRLIHGDGDPSDRNLF